MQGKGINGHIEMAAGWQQAGRVSIFLLIWYPMRPNDKTQEMRPCRLLRAYAGAVLFVDTGIRICAQSFSGLRGRTSKTCKQAKVSRSRAQVSKARKPAKETIQPHERQAVQDSPVQRACGSAQGSDIVV